jgi:multimeric flavodoxin WrbA
MNIDYCNACGFCEKTGHCRIKDDMTPIYEQFNKSDGTIVVSPVYFDSIPAKLKTVVDRTQAFFASKYILKKPSIDRSKKRIGMYIAVGGSSPYESQFKGGQIIMDFFFKSVNSKLKYTYNINSSDEMSYKDNDEHVENIDKLINSYINEIKELAK